MYKFQCYPDCIYRETGAMVNGKIKMERVKQYLEQHVHRRDQDIVAHIVHSFEACLGNGAYACCDQKTYINIPCFPSVKNHMKSSNIESYKVLPHGCSPFAGIIYSCVNAETFLKCPPKMWKNERPCNLAKEFAEQCNPLPHVPLPSS